MAVRSTIATKDGCNEYLYILIQLRLCSAYSSCSAGDRGPIRSNWSHVPRFPFLYCDQAIGYLLLPLLVGFTFGSFGAHGKESRQIFARKAPAVTDGQFWTALFTT